MIAHTLRYAVVGAPPTVRRGLANFIEATGADEILLTGHIYDHSARLRSFEIMSQVHGAASNASATSAWQSSA